MKQMAAGSVLSFFVHLSSSFSFAVILKVFSKSSSKSWIYVSCNTFIKEPPPNHSSSYELLERHFYCYIRYANPNNGSAVTEME